MLLSNRSQWPSQCRDVGFELRPRREPQEDGPRKLNGCSAQLTKSIVYPPSFTQCFCFVH